MERYLALEAEAKGKGSPSIIWNRVMKRVTPGPQHIPQQVRLIKSTDTGWIIRNRLLHIGFLIFRVFWIYPQAFSFKPFLADAT